MELIDYTDFATGVVNTLQIDASAPTIVPRLEYYLGRNRDRTEPPGHQRVDSIFEFLDSLQGDGEPVRRSKSQQLFHAAFLNAALPHIYGWDDFERYRDMILKRQQMDELNSEVFIVTPRRFGKTWAVSMFCAALLYCCPGMWISTFSTGQRASSSLLEQVAKWIRGAPDGERRIKRINKEQIYLSGDSDSDVRRFYSYPSNPRTLRGTGAKIVILEEAAQVNIAVFTEVIVPLLGVRNTSILGISTPEGKNNFYSQLVDKRDEYGKRRFKSIELQLVCDKCKQEGWLDTNVSECPHMRDVVPPWKTDTRTELVKDLMSNTPELFQREHLGMITDLTTQAFPNDVVDKLMNAPRITEHEMGARDIETVFVAVDPCGGGESSMAICSGAYMSDNTLVVRHLSPICFTAHQACATHFEWHRMCFQDMGTPGARPLAVLHSPWTARLWTPGLAREDALGRGLMTPCPRGKPLREIVSLCPSWRRAIRPPRATRPLSGRRRTWPQAPSRTDTSSRADPASLVRTLRLLENAPRRPRRRTRWQVFAPRRARWLPRTIHRDYLGGASGCVLRAGHGCQSSPISRKGDWIGVDLGPKK